MFNDFFLLFFLWEYEVSQDYFPPLLIFLNVNWYFKLKYIGLSFHLKESWKLSSYFHESLMFIYCPSNSHNKKLSKNKPENSKISWSEDHIQRILAKFLPRYGLSTGCFRPARTIPFDWQPQYSSIVHPEPIH